MLPPIRRLRVPAAPLAAFVALLVAAAPASAQTSGSVLVVGDSLEVGTSPYLQQYLPGVPIKVDAVESRPSSEVLQALREDIDPSQSVVVFDAGTNDDPSQPSTLAAVLAAAGALAGDRCMVVATINRSPYDGYTVDGLNAAVTAFAASRPGTQVADWRGAVLANPGILYSDGIHPGSSGYQLRGQIVARAIQGCLVSAPSQALPANASGTPNEGSKQTAPALSPKARLAQGRALAARLVAGEVLGHFRRMFVAQGPAPIAVFLAAAIF